MIRAENVSVPAGNGLEEWRTRRPSGCGAVVDQLRRSAIQGIPGIEPTAKSWAVGLNLSWRIQADTAHSRPACSFSLQ